MFLADQRGPRKICIGSVDILTTNKVKRNLHRKSIRKSVTTTSNTLPAQRSTAVDQVADAESSTSAIDSDSDYDSSPT